MSTIDTPEAPLKSSGAPEYSSTKGLVVDVALRVLLFATALVAIIVMVTSKQTKMIPVAPGLVVPMTAKFTQSPAFM
ncbi:putative casparian strip membrane protein [Helianthus annuus]|nr:putative casparian strip membrane protein [Helianthus annuus]KAJ0498370.1 putative casparian strip membrane protein [Helianthus annuus]KAJ0664380.1 putative casparian strip membrane protein [Helianthus annuus]KAJ0671841.1 putative casparian strip membrane protein [Helianthus annuus]